MNFGRVKFYKARPSERYGFIVKDEGGEVFFGRTDGFVVEPGPFEPRWTTRRLDRDPVKGERVAFEEVDSHNGSKARWTYENDYLSAKQLSRPVDSAVLLRKYPFLQEILERYRGQMNQSVCGVRAELLTLDVLCRPSLGAFLPHDPIPVFYFAVIGAGKGALSIEQLRPQLWRRDAAPDPEPPYAGIAEQLYHNRVSFSRLVAVVEVDLRDTLKPTATIYVPRST